MWRELAEQDIKDTLSEREFESYTKAAEGPGWDPGAVGRILGRTAELVRGYIASSPRGVRFNPSPRFLPPSLIGPAADYAAVTLLRRIPKDIRKERLDARNEAIKLFEAVAEGKTAVEPDSEDALTTTGAGPAELVSSTTPRLTPDQLAGL